MDKVIYKGTIRNLRNLKEEAQYLGVIEQNERVSFCETFDRYFANLGYQDLDYLKSNLRIQHLGTFVVEYNTKYYKTLNKCLQRNIFGEWINDYNPIEILYEEIVDENGDVYCRELYTKAIFPMLQASDCQKHKYSIIKGRSEDTNRKILKLLKNFDMSLEGLLKCECFIEGHVVADHNEIEKYQTKFDKGLNRKGRKERFINKIMTLSKQNVFKKEIVAKKEEVKERLKEGEITSLMESIEFLLIKLKKSNIDLYQKYKEEYEEMLQNENSLNLTLNHLTVVNLQKLMVNIEVELICIKENASNILDYLNNVRREYLENFLLDKEEKTSLKLTDLEKICEMFLVIKDRFSFKEQRLILKNIAFLYLFELKENINELTIDKLKNSYVNDYLKSILININVLQELGLIKSNLIRDLNEDLSLESVLSLIQEMEFVTLEEAKVKDYIKKITF